jgi:uncharacterized protein involved in exopolysaccharide biosynthesis
MTRAVGPHSVKSGSELQAHNEAAAPLHFAPLSGGDWDEDELTRARRRRRRWQWAGGCALGLAGAAAIVLFASRVYEARSSILIRPPNADATVPQAVDGALQSEIEILRSSDVIDHAVEKVGVETLYPGLAGEAPEAALAAAGDRVRAALAVRTLPGSDVIEVVFRHPVSPVAADTVNRVVERYQETRRSALAPAANERFLNQRIEEQKAKLAAAETALAEFHSRNLVASASDPRRALADRNAVLEAELRTLRDAFDAEKTAGNSEDPSVGRARARLDELEIELQRTLNTHVEGSRAVTKVRHEIGLVKNYLASKEQVASRDQQRRLAVLRERQKQLELQVAELERTRRDLPELERQGRELERARDVIASRLDAYQRELESATVAAHVGEHRVAVAVRVLEEAHAPTTTVIPAGRTRFVVALTGVAVLVLLGAAIADWLERRRARQKPMVWTAHVGAGGEGGSVALLMPNQQGGPRGGPMVLLLSGNSDRNGGGGRAQDPDGCD